MPNQNGRNVHRDDDRNTTDRHGGGQSGYGSGRSGDDRSMGPGYRNQASANRSYEDRQGMHTDDRFTGRGGEGYWEDRSERDGGQPRSPNGFRGSGNAGAVQQASEDNQGRYPDEDGPEWGRTGGRWANVPQAGLPQDDMQPMPGNDGQQPMGGHRGKGPVGYTRSDDRIRENVCEALHDDDHIDATHIEVVVKNGEVILTGTVDDRRQKRLAEDLVERMPGVEDVQNQLRVGSEPRGNQDTGTAVGKTETEMSTDKKHRA